MKTIRMSASTENRNARKAITALGGNRGRGVRIPQEMQIVSGRRLRRANRSGKAQIGTFMLEDDGTLRHLPVNLKVDVDPYTRLITAWYVG
ncbi:hypothetical protein ACFQ15_00670 [Sphingomonas hankookensis]|jgi:hypothetical protein|uniref:hypothetical protein n=1 Tax=Sphingomonas hankookensis TaxID=563996 RepID=UPI001F566CBB|nr:hypothetical protein [Sphingomonas hankookensis]